MAAGSTVHYRALAFLRYPLQNGCLGLEPPLSFLLKTLIPFLLQQKMQMPLRALTAALFQSSQAHRTQQRGLDATCSPSSGNLRHA